MNRTIKILLFASIFTDTGFGFVEPILSIFVKDNLAEGTILTAGFATTIYLVVKSVLQLPFARYIDNHDNRVRWLLIGTAVCSVVPFLYIYSHNLWVLYLSQMLYGLGAAMAYPTWLSLWSTHLDKHREGFEWSVYSTAIGLGTALTAGIGAAIAQYIGFNYAFALVGIMEIVGFLLMLGLERDPALAHD